MASLPPRSPQPASSVLSVLLRGTRILPSRRTRDQESLSSALSTTSSPCSSVLVQKIPPTDNGGAVKAPTPFHLLSFAGKKRQRVLCQDDKTAHHGAASDPDADELDFFGNSGHRENAAASFSRGSTSSPPSSFCTGSDNRHNGSSSTGGGVGSGRSGNKASEEAAGLRKKFRIHVKAADASTLPKPFESFSDCVVSVAPPVSAAVPPAPADAGEANIKVVEKKKKRKRQCTDPDSNDSEDNTLKNLQLTEKGTHAEALAASAGCSPRGEASASSADIVAPWTAGGKKTVSIDRLPDWLLQNLQEAKIITPTPIQMQAIPVLLQGANLLATAPTGSGKTLAFLLPLLAYLKKPGKAFCRALVICPSRELALQTQRIFDRFAGRNGFRCCLFDELELGADGNCKKEQRLDVGISTPLKVVYLLKNNQVSLEACRHLVLDEADKLLDWGFAPQLDEILAKLTKRHIQICLFSATLPRNVLSLADSFMHSPVHISIGAPNAAALSIHQELLFCTNEEGKLLALRTLHLTGRFIPPVLIFVQTKERAQQLYCELLYDGIFVECIHADKTKQQRDDIVEAFRKGQIWVLICTDVMARGVDFKNVEVVINYDFPQSASTYIHRIGRTGRAGRGGRAITFYTSQDIPCLRNVVGVMQQTSTCNVPSWMRKLTKLKKVWEKKSALPRRKPILTTPGGLKTSGRRTFGKTRGEKELQPKEINNRDPKEQVVSKY